jgi:hypothetical protein
MAVGDKVVEGARLSGQGHTEGTLVEFEQDVFPHVTGEIKRLNKDELARVDKVAAGRKLKGTIYRKRDLTADEKEALKRDRSAAESTDADKSEEGKASE